MAVNVQGKGMKKKPKKQKLGVKLPVLGIRGLRKDKSRKWLVSAELFISSSK